MVFARSPKIERVSGELEIAEYGVKNWRPPVRWNISRRQDKIEIHTDARDRSPFERLLYIGNMEMDLGDQP